MIRLLGFLLLLPGATYAASYSCNFETECYEDEPCRDSRFTVDVYDMEQKIVTEFGEFPILAIRDEPGLLTVFVHAPGSVYLLSSSADTARFTTHITQGPQVISYLGHCEVVG